METSNNIITSLYSDKGPLTKPQFVTIMEIIKDMMDRDNAFATDMAEAFNRHNGSADSFMPIAEYSSKTVNLLIQWIVSVMGDNDGNTVSDSWIGYYIWERDWGRDNKPGDPCVVDRDGTPIPFDTIENVYDLIINNKPKKE